MVDDFKKIEFSGHKDAYTQELTVVVAAYIGYEKTQDKVPARNVMR